MVNGDVFTGEIRSLSHGRLTLRLAYSATDMDLDWASVQNVKSIQRFTVVTTSGAETSYSLQGTPALLTVRETPDLAPRTLTDVIELDPDSEGIWPDLHGDADLGYSATGTGTVGAVTAQADLQYATRLNAVAIQAHTQIISSQDVLTGESLVQGSYYRQAQHSPLYFAALTSFVNSSQQEVRFRSSTGGGMGLHAVATAHANVDVAAGLAYTHEALSTGDAHNDVQHGDGLDAVVAFDSSYDLFSRVALVNSTWLYPGLSEAGRLRMNLSQSVYFKTKAGPYLRLSFHDYFDNMLPPNALTHDLGGTASFGWSFH